MDALTRHSSPPQLSQPHAMEHTLVQDLRYTFLGADTPSLVYEVLPKDKDNNNKDKDNATGNPPATHGGSAHTAPATHGGSAHTPTLTIHLRCDTSSLSNGQLDFVTQFSTLALIAKKLHITSDSPTNCAIETAFYTCVRQTLVDFHSFINNLYLNSQLDSFLSLDQNLLDWNSRIRHIYWLYLNLKSTSIINFLSILHKSSLYSDPIINSISIEYFQIVTTPYLEIFKNWLLKGILNSSENFYIYSTSNYFYQDLKKLPSFINSNIANLIFNTGYSIYYLKNLLNDQLWCDSFYNNNSKIEILNELEISKLNKIVQSHLMNLLLPDFKSEISHLNDILLLKSGDFINNILLNSQNILSKNISLISSNQLIKIVQNSIDSSSLIYNWEFNDYSRIDARLLNLKLNSSNLTGWDFFTLDFKLKNHINYLINKDYKDYLKIFNFLFKFLKIKSNLNIIWKKSSIFAKNFKNLNSNHLKRKFDLMKFQFISFINIIFSFIENNLLLLNFNKLIDNLISSNDLNLQKLIDFHNSFINSISNSILFSNPINQSLFNLILIIENFIKINNNFLNNFKKLSNFNQIINNFEINLNQFIKLLKLSNNNDLINLSILLEN